MHWKNYLGQELSITVDDSRDALLTDFGKATLKDRYLLKGETPQKMFARVAAAFSDDEAMAQRVYGYISKFWFMPATPVLSNGGTERGNPISCFLNSVEDSMGGISSTWNESIWLAAKGGGIGTCWSDVRSINESVGDVGETSGIIPFLKVQDALTLAISQGRLRRGSAAVYLDIFHPEIEEFIEIRKPTGDPNRKTLNLHHGVMITDKFMLAVEEGKTFDLISPHDGSIRKTINARDLWQRILTLRVETGEPYLVFSDTVNRKAPEVYKKLGLKVRQSNLCSEVSLATGIDHLGNNRTAVCCLSSVNEAKQDEWYGNRQFIKDILLFLDNVLTAFINNTENVAGFEKARYSAMRERAIGLGVMGFHTYLQSKGIPFESVMAHVHNIRIHGWLKSISDEINEEVAIERGACPDGVDAGLNIRWSHISAIAPTASISIIAGGASPCVEPWPSNVYVQKTLSGSFEVRNAQLQKLILEKANKLEYPESVDQFVEDVWASISEREGSVQHLNFLSDLEKDVFKTFMEIDQRWVVSHAAARAPLISQMSSNNLCLAADVHKRDLHLIHMKAWKEGVPSLYYLRSKSLGRGSKVSHMAGEMPQPNETDVEVVLKESLTREQYEVCLSCQ